MQRQKIIVIIGIVLALLAVVLLKLYLDDQQRQAEEKAQQQAQLERQNETPVLVAMQDIPPGAVMDPGLFEVRAVSNMNLVPQAITSLDSVAGMMALAPISKGEQLSRTKLAYPRQAGGLAEITPKGKRAITIAVDNLASLAGMIKPADNVDVIALVPVPVQGSDGKMTTEGAVIPMFQNVLVLAVGQNTGGMRAAQGRYEQEEGKEISPLITLALTPQEANLIAFIQEQGKIRLILRSPTDATVESLPPASWQTFFSYVMPQQQQQPDKPEEPKVLSYVEIYRGLNKEKVPLYK